MTDLLLVLVTHINHLTQSNPPLSIYLSFSFNLCLSYQLRLSYSMMFWLAIFFLQFNILYAAFATHQFTLNRNVVLSTTNHFQAFSSLFSFTYSTRTYKNLYLHAILPHCFQTLFTITCISKFKSKYRFWLFPAWTRNKAMYFQVKQYG